MPHPFVFTPLDSAHMKNNTQDNLSDFGIHECPFTTYRRWYDEATKTEPYPDGMSVATVDDRGIPRNRWILFKGIVEGKLLFFTNYLSQKGMDLGKNPHISLNFFWSTLGKQVRVTGKGEFSSRDLSEAYFSSRDTESQIASFISHQSEKISSKVDLMKKFTETKDLQNNNESYVTCPNHWGGVLVDPFEFEFFLYGDYRLNDRFLFQKTWTQGTFIWELNRLQP